MDDIFVGQDRLTITIKCNVDLSQVTAAEIRYIKPKDVEGAFEATIDAPNSQIKYVVQGPSDIDVPGEWVFWPHLTYADGKGVPGTATKQTVLKEGR